MINVATGLTLPAFLVRADTTVLVMDLRAYGGVLQPSGATISIYDESSQLVVDDAVVTIANDRLTFTVTPAMVPATLSLSDRWQIRWRVTVPDMPAQTITQPAHLCRTQILPVISDYHLLRRHSDLKNLLPADQASWQVYLDDAWEDIQIKLLAMGRRPYLILSPYSLKGVHTAMTLARIFRDLSTYTQGPGKYTELASHYEEEAEKLWGALRFDYDHDEDGFVSDEDEKNTAGEPVVYLTATPAYWKP